MDANAPEVYDHLGGKDAIGAKEGRRNSLPAGMMLSSPLVTEQFSTPSWKENEKHDIVCVKFAKQVLREYFDPEVAPTPDTMKVLALARMEKGFEEFLPNNILLFVGTKECMRDDILELSDRVKKNSSITVQVVQENLVHDWFVIRDLVKKKSILEQNDKVFIRFIKNALEQAQGRILHSSSPLQDINVRRRQSIRRNSTTSSIMTNSTVLTAHTALETSTAAETELLETLSQVEAQTNGGKSNTTSPLVSPSILGLITV